MPEELKGIESSINKLVEEWLECDNSTGLTLRSAIAALVESECALRVGMALRAVATEMGRVHMFAKVGPPPRLEYLGFDHKAAMKAILSLDLASVAALDAQIIEMRICEYSHVFLKPNELYRFTVDENCEACRNVSSGKPSLAAHDAEVGREARLDEADQWLMSEALNNKARLEWKRKRIDELSRPAAVTLGLIDKEGSDGPRK